MITESGAFGQMERNRSSGRNIAPMPLHSLQIPQDLTWYQSRRLTIYAMERPKPKPLIK
jgi:hypothetical protein